MIPTLPFLSTDHDLGIPRLPAHLTYLRRTAIVLGMRKRVHPVITLIAALSMSAACRPQAASPQMAGEIEGQYPVVEAPASTSLATIALPPTETAELTLFPTIVLPTLTPYPDDVVFSVGQSWEERDIWAWQFGDGPVTLVLIGGIHGGYESNTVVLVEQLVDYFRRNPEYVLPGIRLVLIPTSNPDGLLRGDTLEGRFNARGVDLNRNWGCEWSEEAYLRDQPVDPGPRPFSEPETFALRAYFISQAPDAVIFYHSALGGIFMGACGEHEEAAWMGELLAESTGYPYDGSFTYYEVTGDATNWLAERGVPAAVIELATHDDPEFSRNLAGVMALQCHFVLPGYGEDEAAPLTPDPLVSRLCP